MSNPRRRHDRPRGPRVYRMRPHHRACTLWQAADPSTRASWKAEGLVRYAARGLCPACYLRARNTATLTEHLTQHHQDGVERRRGNCSRCGVHAALSDSLCIDCVHVTNDLDELQQWAS